MKPVSASRRDFLRTGLAATAALGVRRAGADEPKGPSVPGLKFVRIEAGRFRMGNPDQVTSDEDPPAREVVIARPFAVSSTPVTQRVHDWVMGAEANPSRFRGDPDRPLESIRWDEAARFCNALSQRLGLKPAFSIEGGQVGGLPADGFRLPLEAEWEYACRAGSDTVYCFGDDPAALAEYAWFELGPEGPTHPVGTKKPNAWGLHDVHGNVDEWCWDWFGPVSASGSRTPSGPATGTFRVVRGGSYLPKAAGLRSSFRGRAEPSRRASTIGFRLVRSLPYE